MNNVMNLQVTEKTRSVLGTFSDYWLFKTALFSGDGGLILQGNLLCDFEIIGIVMSALSV
jgi:hypothetical protein